MAEVTGEDAVNLLKAINDFKITTWVGVAVLLALAGIAHLIWKQWQSKRQHTRQLAIEAGKTERARIHAEALNRLSDTMQAHSDTEEANVKRIELLANNIHQTVNSVKEMANYIADIATGSISYDEGLKVVEATFNKSVVYEVSNIISHSLVENDYVGRQEYVERKVKTAIGEVLASSREYLRGLSLPFGVGTFFVLVEDHRATRYKLCDQLWFAVEPLYRASIEKVKKLEEAKLQIENCVRDHFESARRKTKQAGSTSAHQRILRTPRPGG